MPVVLSSCQVVSPVVKKCKSLFSITCIRCVSLYCFPLSGYLLDEALYTDVIFKVGPDEQVIEAHRIILASASSMFQLLLYQSQQPILLNDKILVHDPEYSMPPFKVFLNVSMYRRISYSILYIITIILLSPLPWVEFYGSLMNNLGDLHK